MEREIQSNQDAEFKGREIFAIGIAHHKCPPDTIAKFSLAGENLNLAREIAFSENGVDEVFAISTCNRVEIFAVGKSDKLEDACLKAISLNGKRDISEFKNVAQTYKNKDALLHLFETASGLDSQMVGETEILGQIKNAYADSLEHKHSKTVLNRALQKAIQCAKWIRTNTNIGSGNTTIGAVAAELSARIFEDLKDIKILLAGSGEVGRSVAMALSARGAENITVASRTWQNAHSLSDDVKGSAISFERIYDELKKFDVAIFALSQAPNLINFETAKNAESSRKNPMFLIDLAVPHNVEKSCAELDGVFLYDLQDLTNIANENMNLRLGEIENAKAIIREKVDYLCERFS